MFQQGEEEICCFLVNYSVSVEQQLYSRGFTGCLLPVSVSVWVEYGTPFNVLGGVKHIGT